MSPAAECMVQDTGYKVFKENTVVDAIWATMVVLTYFLRFPYKSSCLVRGNNFCSPVVLAVVSESNCDNTAGRAMV